MNLPEPRWTEVFVVGLCCTSPRASQQGPSGRPSGARRAPSSEIAQEPHSRVFSMRASDGRCSRAGVSPTPSGGSSRWWIRSRVSASYARSPLGGRAASHPRRRVRSFPRSPVYCCYTSGMERPRAPMPA